MNCLICSAMYDKNVTLLKCKDYICPKCYCHLKTNRIYKCPCGKKLIRGCRKYKEKN